MTALFLRPDIETFDVMYYVAMDIETFVPINVRDLPEYHFEIVVIDDTDGGVVFCCSLPDNVSPHLLPSPLDSKYSPLGNYFYFKVGIQ